VQLFAAVPKKSPENQKEHIINFDQIDSDIFSVATLPPPPPPPPPIEKVVVNPMVPPEKGSSPPPRTNTIERVVVNPMVLPEKRSSPPRASTPTSATPFSVASLQQYTNNFREENLIRESRYGKVYLAELPNGKVHITLS
jgi:hypothetical protein